jgi:hypothetical protein
MVDFKLAIFVFAANVLRAGDRNPVLRLRQGYGACTLLGAGELIKISLFTNLAKSILFF